MHLVSKPVITSCVINVPSVLIVPKFLPKETSNIVTIQARHNGDTVVSAVKNLATAPSLKKSNGTWSVQIMKIVASLSAEAVSYQLKQVRHDH